jgi:peroxiredoxin
MSAQEPGVRGKTARKPFLGRFRTRWRLIAEIGLVIIAVFAIYQYQTRHLLDSNAEIAPPLELITLAGDPIDLHETTASTALVYFFAPWCKICAASAHNIRALRRSQDDKSLSILLVALDWQDIDEVRSYADRHKLDVPILLGNATTAEEWHVFGFPTYYVVDAERRIAHKDFGYSSHFGLWWRTKFAN